METNETPEYKGLLQRWCMRANRPRLRYIVVSSTQNPSHFVVDVRSASRKLGTGEGPTRKAAEKDAARNAYEALDEKQLEAAQVNHVPRARSRKGRKERRIDERKRKSARGARYGREFERTMVTYLTAMREEGVIEHFKRHLPMSREDRAGKDFTVRGKGGTSVSFGVTTSRKRQAVSQSRHPDVKTFHFPHNTKPETIRRRILELLEEQKPPT